MATGLAQVHRGESCLLRLRRPGSRLGGNRGYPSLYLASMSQHQQSIRFSLRRLLAIVVLVAVVGAIYVAIVGPSPMLRLFGGAENMAIVREATRVETGDALRTAAAVAGRAGSVFQAVRDVAGLARARMADPAWTLHLTAEGLNAAATPT